MSKGEPISDLTVGDFVEYAAGFSKPKQVGYVEERGMKSVTLRDARTQKTTTLKGGKGWVRRLTGRELVEAQEKIARGQIDPDSVDVEYDDEPVQVSTRSRLRSVEKEGQPKRSEKFKAFVRRFPCCAPDCGRMPVDPHHHGKHAAGEKTDDQRCVPLCREHHDVVTGKVNGTSGALPGMTKAETDALFWSVSVGLLVIWSAWLEEQWAEERLRQALDSAHGEI